MIPASKFLKPLAKPYLNTLPTRKNKGKKLRKFVWNLYCRLLAAAAIAIITSTATFATESGGGAYPNGAENFMSGALPPPGTYFLDYLTHYSADNFKDTNGNSAIPDFRVRAIANGFRFVHMTDKQIFGGNWGMHAFLPFAKVDVTAFGRNQSKEGLADIVIDPIMIAWHTRNFHYAFGLDIFMPTGSYDKNDIANLSRNYWTFEPIVAGTYLSDGGLDVSMKLQYDFNTKNRATDYRSGQEFNVDYTVAQKFDNFSVGVGGYYYRQMSDDEQAGVKVGTDGNRGRLFGIGPQIRYDHKNMMFFLTYTNESGARNKPEGNRLWLKFFMPL